MERDTRCILAPAGCGRLSGRRPPSLLRSEPPCVDPVNRLARRGASAHAPIARAAAPRPPACAYTLAPEASPLAACLKRFRSPSAVTRETSGTRTHRHERCTEETQGASSHCIHWREQLVGLCSGHRSGGPTLGYEIAAHPSLGTRAVGAGRHHVFTAANSFAGAGGRPSAPAVERTRGSSALLRATGAKPTRRAECIGPPRSFIHRGSRRRFLQPVPPVPNQALVQSYGSVVVELMGDVPFWRVPTLVSIAIPV